RRCFAPKAIALSLLITKEGISGSVLKKRERAQQVCLCIRPQKSVGISPYPVRDRDELIREGESCWIFFTLESPLLSLSYSGLSRNHRSAFRRIPWNTPLRESSRRLCSFI